VQESGWFATHPSVDERVRALIDFAGGHDVVIIAPERFPVEDSQADGAFPPIGDGSQPGFLPPQGRHPLDPPQAGPWG
jgi:heat shock protein HtpX